MQLCFYFIFEYFLSNQTSIRSSFKVFFKIQLIPQVFQIKVLIRHGVNNPAEFVSVH